jgi:hypothetical protein
VVLRKYSRDLDGHVLLLSWLEGGRTPPLDASRIRGASDTARNWGVDYLPRTSTSEASLQRTSRIAVMGAAILTMGTRFDSYRVVQRVHANS